MKQIYNHIKQWKFKDKKDIHDTSVFRHFTFLEPEKATTKTYDIDSFEILEATAESGFFWNAEKKISIFGRAIIELPQKENIFAIPSNITIKKKNFKSIELIESYELATNLLIKDITNKLSADNFTKYLKDRGVIK